MRLSKPSPSMVVATIALVFAATGTGIAATGAITGVDITNGSITSADLATGAVTSADLATGAVKSVDLATGAVTSADLATGAVTSPKIPGGTITSRTIQNGSIETEDIAPVARYDGEAAKAAMIRIAEGFRAAAIPGPAGPVGAVGSAGDLGPGGFSFNSISANIPIGVLNFERFYGNTGPGAQTFAAAATTAPAVPTTISNGRVDLLEVPSDAPLVIEVGVTVARGTPQATGQSCIIPLGQTGCTFPGPVKVPAGAPVAWLVTVFDPPPSSAFSAFKVGMAWTSTSG